MRLFNTMTRKKEDFQPIDGTTARIYSCGPTVYSTATIGNLRAYVFTDILKKSLEEVGGFKVFDVMNTTDVGHLQSDADEGEDKVELAAKKAAVSAQEIAKRYTDEFLCDTDLLNIRRPKVIAPASAYVKQMISHVQELEKNGYTYKLSDGIYFNSAKFEDYYKLRGKPSDDKTGARVAFGEKLGKNDFCLWRFTPPTALQKFDSPWGVGIPGWHIECSAIARQYLGDQFDIHTGGVDHIPIHHTNERAQTESLTKKPMANFWMHNEFIKIDGQKMSKSLGNVYTLADLSERGYLPVHFRYLCLQTHYRTILNFTFEALDGAKRAYENLIKQIKKNKEVPGLKEEFHEALADDLNTSKALAVLWKAPKKLALEFDKVLSLGLAEALQEKQVEIPQEVIDLANQRLKFKQAKDFGAADKIRNDIKKLGYEIIDTADGFEIYSAHGKLCEN